MKTYSYEVISTIKKRLHVEVPANSEDEAWEKLQSQLTKTTEDEAYYNGDTISVEHDPQGYYEER